MTASVCRFSQVQLMLRSGDVQRFGLCWHNLPGNNPLMCPMNLHEAFWGGRAGLLLTYKQVCTTRLRVRPDAFRAQSGVICLI